MNTFSGKVIHSHDYRDNTNYQKLNVIVLGAGPSGIDLAIEIADVANEIILSHDLNPGYTGPLPIKLRRAKGILSVKNNTVTFKDGQTSSADVIVLCTGYKINFPFLHPDCNLEVMSNNCRFYPLYKHFINCHHTSMAVIGIPFKIPPFPIFHQQVLLFLAHLANKELLPTYEEMIKDIESDLNVRKTMGLPIRHAHKMEGDLLWQYDAELALLSGAKPTPKLVKDLYSETSKLRSNNALTYRQTSFKYKAKECQDLS